MHLTSAEHQLSLHSGKLVTCIRFLMAFGPLCVKYNISEWTTVSKDRGLIDLAFIMISTLVTRNENRAWALGSRRRGPPR